MGLEQQDLKPLKKNILCLCNIKTAKIATAVKAWGYCQTSRSSGQRTNSQQPKLGLSEKWAMGLFTTQLYAYLLQRAPLNLPLVRVDGGGITWPERGIAGVWGSGSSQRQAETGETCDGDARVTGNTNRQLNQSGWPRLLLCTDGCPGPSEEAKPGCDRGQQVMTPQQLVCGWGGLQVWRTMISLCTLCSPDLKIILHYSNATECSDPLMKKVHSFYGISVS